MMLEIRIAESAQHWWWHCAGGIRIGPGGVGVGRTHQQWCWWWHVCWQRLRCAGGVGIDMFALLLGSGVVLMCSYLSAVALVVVVVSVLVFVLVLVVLALMHSFFLLVLGWC